MLINIIYHTPIKILVEAARVCYDSMSKSDDVGEKDKELLQRLVKLGHFSIFEHCSVYIDSKSGYIIDWFSNNKYSRIDNMIIKTNLRVLLENQSELEEVIDAIKWTKLSFLFDVKPKKLSIPETIEIDTELGIEVDLIAVDYDKERYTFKIKGISRLCLQELVRHRESNFSVRSTRFTLKKVLNNPIFDQNYPYTDDREIKELLDELMIIQDESDYLFYFDILRRMRMKMKQGTKIDEIKYLLPENWKVELVWTIDKIALDNFFKLRLSKKAHYEIRELAYKIFKLINN